jgi:hypothetical protein
MTDAELIAAVRRSEFLPDVEDTLADRLEAVTAECDEARAELGECKMFLAELSDDLERSRQAVAFRLAP